MAVEQQSRKLTCGYCQGENDIPPFARVVTCEFCGSPNELKSGKVIENHHMLSVYFSGSRLQELIPQYLSKYVGVPGDFSDKVVFTKFDLEMMPFWLFKFHGRTDYRGNGKYCSPQHSNVWSRSINISTRPERGTIDLDQTCLVFGYKEQHRQIRDEKIPAGAKEAFNITAVNNAFSKKNGIALLSGIDIAVDALDNISTRLELSEVCKNAFTLTVPLFPIEDKFKFISDAVLA